MPARQPFVCEPFRPARGLGNPHVQTIAANFLRRTAGLHFQRQQLDTPDGDVITLDYADVPQLKWATADRAAPIGLVLHGLEGNARRSYMQEAYRQLAQRGIRPVGLNYRSCSGEPNRTVRTYHAGFTPDVALAVENLTRRYPHAPLGLIGFSLGGSILLRYLGENGAELPPQLQAAVAISPPYDLAANAVPFNDGAGRFYAQRILRSLQAKVLADRQRWAGVVDVQAIARAHSVRAFDAAFVVPVFGFHDLQDYYQQCSAQRFLPGIRRPTLLLSARDDPFFVPDLPEAVIQANPALQACFPAHGGHVGFLEGWGRVWAERQAARFLAHSLVRP